MQRLGDGQTLMRQSNKITVHIFFLIIYFRLYDLSLWCLYFGLSTLCCTPERMHGSRLRHWITDNLHEQMYKCAIDYSNILCWHKQKLCLF